MATEPKVGCEYANVAVAARVLGVSPSFLNKERITGGGPPFVKFGSAVRYHMPSLHEWAAAQTRCSTSDRGVAAAGRP
jgi:hypothetical protein